MDTDERTRRPGRLPGLADTLLVAALLLVLALSWQGAPRSSDSSLEHSARTALMRHVGKQPGGEPAGAADRAVVRAPAPSMPPG